MVAITYTTFHTLYGLNISDVSQTVTEAIIDQAIDLLNLYANQSISNLSGGSSTVTGKERGAIMLVAWAIYHSLDPSTASTGGLTDAPASPMMNPVIERTVERAARMLTSSTRTFLRT